MCDRQRILQAIRQDDMAIVETLKNLISSESGRHAVMTLKDDAGKSESILNLIDKVCRDPRQLGATHTENSTNLSDFIR